MRNTTPIFPGFHMQTLRRKPRSWQQKLTEKMVLLKQKSFKQIGEVFEKFIPHALLKPERDGAMSRRRLFSKENTFWAFFSQVLDADGGCKEVIRKLQSYASIKGVKVPSSSTASYCVARKKLDEQMLSDILEHTADRLEEMPETGLMNNRRVIVVDGSQHAGYVGEPRGLAAVVLTEVGVRISDGTYLRLFFTEKRGIAQSRPWQ
jgi:hypothetical protein